MLPPGSWLHITVGFILGIISTAFAVAATCLLNQKNASRKLISTLALFSLSVALVAFIYGSALSGGLLVEWQLLGRPSRGDPAVKMIDIGYVQAQSGDKYHFTCLGCSDGNWEQVDAITNDEEVHLIPSPGNCGTLSFLPLLQRDFIDSEVACVAWGPGIAKVAYAIDDGGRVYSWWHGVGEFSGIEILLFPVIGGPVSCAFGIIIILASSLLKKKTQKRVPHINSMK